MKHLQDRAALALGAALFALLLPSLFAPLFAPLLEPLARVLDGLAGAQSNGAAAADDLDHALQRIAPRWFVVRDAHASSVPVLVHPRQTMTWMRGPMTRNEIRQARGHREQPQMPPIAADDPDQRSTSENGRTAQEGQARVERTPAQSKIKF